MTTRGQSEGEKEQREQHGRRQRDKDHRGKDDDRKRQQHHYDFDKFMRRKDETKWGKGYCQDRAKKEGHHHGFYCPDGGDKLGKEDRDDLSNRKERLRNKVSEKVSMRFSDVSVPGVFLSWWDLSSDWSDPDISVRPGNTPPSMSRRVMVLQQVRRMSTKPGEPELKDSLF